MGGETKASPDSPEFILHSCTFLFGNREWLSGCMDGASLLALWSMFWSNEGREERVKNNTESGMSLEQKPSLQIPKQWCRKEFFNKIPIRFNRGGKKSKTQKTKHKKKTILSWQKFPIYILPKASTLHGRERSVQADRSNGLIKQAVSNWTRSCLEEYHASLAIGVVNNASYNMHTQHSACISRKALWLIRYNFLKNFPSKSCAVAVQAVEISSCLAVFRSQC